MSDVQPDGFQATPFDLSKVHATEMGYSEVMFSPSGFKCSLKTYEETFVLMAQWNPLEVGGNKMAGLIERYLRTGDPHEEPEDPFAIGGRDGFIDEW